MAGSVLGNANLASLLPPVDAAGDAVASSSSASAALSLRLLAMGAVVPGPQKVVGASFHAEGTLYANVDADGVIRVVDALQGRLRKLVRTESLRAHRVAYSHSAHAVLCAGTVDHAVRYLSVHDDRYLRLFYGHDGPVTALCVSPADDTFLTAGTDRKVLLWNLNARAPRPTASLSLPTHCSSSLCAFDPEASVFAAAGLVKLAQGSSQTHTIYLYDVRNYSAGPFCTFHFSFSTLLDLIKINVHNITPRRAESYATAEWTAVEFSPDGEFVLVSTKSPLRYVIDSFEGNIKKVLAATGGGEDLIVTGSAWSPDSAYVLGGTGEGAIVAWNAKTGRVDTKLEGHAGGVGTVRCNPKYQVLASTCTATALWINKPDGPA